MLLIEVDGGKIVDAHSEIDLPNDAIAPGPLREIREHMAADPQVPVAAQYAGAELAGMPISGTLPGAKSEGAGEFPIDIG